MQNFAWLGLALLGFALLCLAWLGLALLGLALFGLVPLGLAIPWLGGRARDCPTTRTNNIDETHVVRVAFRSHTKSHRAP